MATKKSVTKSSPVATPAPTGSAATPATSEERGSRKTRIGVVVSDKMVKTVVVRVDRLIRHSLYPRMIRNSNKFHVHNENNQAKVGDLVRIMETRPMSRTKRWRVVEVLRRGGAPGPADAGLEGAREGQP
jgi:small subunit ribosomal protein S17